MDEDVSRSGMDYAGEMQLNMHGNGSEYRIARETGNREEGVWIAVTSVEEKPLDYIYDNETLRDISCMNTENDMATITFSKGEYDKIEMKIQFKKQNESSSTSPEEMKDHCVEALCDISGQDVIADIERILGVEVENVKRGSIILQLRFTSPDFIRKFNEAKQNGELEKLLIKIQNLCQTKQGPTYPNKSESITANELSDSSEDAIVLTELGAPCPGFTTMDNSPKEGESSFIQPSEDMNIDIETGATYSDGRYITRLKQETNTTVTLRPNHSPSNK